jgi:hypothetical protein
MEEQDEILTDHLSDEELFALAVPPTGAPEPLPVHLSGCLRCSRALADWKSAVRDLADEDEDEIARRSSEEWRVAGDATVAAIRRAGAPGRGRGRALRWVLPVAASFLLFALWIGGRHPAAPIAFDDTTGLSTEDRADDTLLRDVDRLASGEENGNGWNALAPDPAAVDSAPLEEERS